MGFSSNQPTFPRHRLHSRQAGPRPLLPLCQASLLAGVPNRGLGHPGHLLALDTASF